MGSINGWHGQVGPGHVGDIGLGATVQIVWMEERERLLVLTEKQRGRV